MKIKILVPFLAGIVFVIITIAVIVTTGRATRAEEEIQDTDFYQFYAESLIGPFQDAQDEIRDPEIGQYYRKLLAEYDLEQVAEEISQTDVSNPDIPLPDIEKIQYAALTLPLREAGKRVQDEQILEFYNRFLKSCGWDLSGQAAGEQ